MKKKTIVLSVLALVVVGFGVVKIKEYYDNRYVESDTYYVRVPDNQSVEIEDLLDSSGKVFDKGKSYAFTAYNEKGESRVVEFSYQTEDPDKLLQPGQFLKVSVSPTIVLGQEVISETDVPQSIRSLLK